MAEKLDEDLARLFGGRRPLSSFTHVAQSLHDAGLTDQQIGELEVELGLAPVAADDENDRERIAGRRKRLRARPNKRPRA